MQRVTVLSIALNHELFFAWGILGRISRSRDDAPEHPVKAIVGLAVNELIGPIEFGRRVDRNDDWPFEPFRAVGQ